MVWACSPSFDSPNYPNTTFGALHYINATNVSRFLLLAICAIHHWPVDVDFSKVDSIILIR